MNGVSRKSIKAKERAFIHLAFFPNTKFANQEVKDFYLKVKEITHSIYPTSDLYLVIVNSKGESSLLKNEEVNYEMNLHFQAQTEGGLIFTLKLNSHRYWYQLFSKLSFLIGNPRNVKLNDTISPKASEPKNDTENSNSNFNIQGLFDDARNTKKALEQGVKTLRSWDWKTIKDKAIKIINTDKQDNNSIKNFNSQISTQIESTHSESIKSPSAKNRLMIVGPILGADYPVQNFFENGELVQGFEFIVRNRGQFDFDETEDYIISEEQSNNWPFETVSEEVINEEYY